MQKFFSRVVINIPIFLQVFLLIIRRVSTYGSIPALIEFGRVEVSTTGWTRVRTRSINFDYGLVFMR